MTSAEREIAETLREEALEREAERKLLAEAVKAKAAPAAEEPPPVSPETEEAPPPTPEPTEGGPDPEESSDPAPAASMAEDSTPDDAESMADDWAMRFINSVRRLMFGIASRKADQKGRFDDRCVRCERSGVHRGGDNFTCDCECHVTRALLREWDKAVGAGSPQG